MGTGHDHRPGRALTATGRHRGRLATVLAITIGIAVAEICGALVSGALVLLADAAHMAADAAGVGLSLLAAYVATRPATDRATFGYARAEILAAMVNALLLLGMAVFIGVEAARRLAAPPEVAPGVMIVFGVVALAGNGVSLLLLRHGQAESGTGIVIVATGFYMADPIASLAVAVLIVPRTWRLLRDAVDVLLEVSPRGIDLTEVRTHMTALDGVVGVHDLHAWTITSGLPVLSAHVVVDPAVLADGRSAAMLDALQACLHGHFDVGHSTFQLEPASHAGHEPSVCL